MKNMKSLYVFVTCFVVFCSVSYVSADTYTHASGLVVQLPNQWKASGGERSAEITLPNSDMHIEIKMLTYNSRKPLNEQLTEYVERKIDDMTITSEPSQNLMGKTEGYYAEGKGTLRGKPIIWLSQIITHKNKTCILVYSSSKESYYRYFSDIYYFFDSFSFN